MYREAAHCRICGNPNLVTVLDLGEQYLTGVFPPRVMPELGKGPVQLVKCTGDDPRKQCGLVQMRHTFPLEEMYGEGYGYRSGLNRAMVEHLHGKADHLAKTADLAAGDLVLDIGSNDGTLLARYAQEGLTLVGIDPSARKFRKYYRPDAELLVDFFSAELFRRHCGGRKAKIVTSIAMFYDLEDPQAFVNDVAAVLADDGIWHLEQSYLPSMLRTNSYDTACHEHLSYFALRQLAWTFEKAGLRVVDVQLNDVNGGSFAVTAAKRNGSVRENRNAIAELERYEASLGLDTPAPFEDFRRRVLAHREDLLRLLDKLSREKKTVLGYGASTKGNVLLQYCNITPAMLPCIAEVNESKFGCYTPGSWIPIVPEREARALNPDYFMVLPWHFRDGIIRREAAFLQGGGKLLFPLPSIEIIS